MHKCLSKEDTIVPNGKGLKDAIHSWYEQVCALEADPTTSDFGHTTVSSTNTLRNFLVLSLSSRLVALPRWRSARIRIVMMMLLMQRALLSRRASFLVVTPP